MHIILLWYVNKPFYLGRNIIKHLMHCKKEHNWQQLNGNFIPYFWFIHALKLSCFVFVTVWERCLFCWYVQQKCQLLLCYEVQKCGTPTVVWGKAEKCWWFTVRLYKLFWSTAAVVFEPFYICHQALLNFKFVFDLLQLYFMTT